MSSLSQIFIYVGYYTTTVQGIQFRIVPSYYCFLNEVFIPSPAFLLFRLFAVLAFHSDRRLPRQIIKIKKADIDY